MTPQQLRDWCTRAFYEVESSVAHKLVRPSNHVSEDVIRDGFEDGLIAANTANADRVGVEVDATWDGAPCIHCGVVPGGSGRKIQHDVHVSAGADPGLFCEAKWLKQQKAHEIAKDIWKLALSRGILADAHAPRCLLLIGGHTDSVRGTVKTLAKNGIVLPFGTTGKVGRPKIPPIDLRSFLQTSLGREALKKLLARGDHYRTPPDCWERFKVRRVAFWHGQAGDENWMVGLFELERVEQHVPAQLTGHDMTQQISTKREC